MSENMPIPYEDGDHCIFYAVQGATTHFNNEGLTTDERDKYQHERGRRLSLYKSITGIEEKKGAWLEISLHMLFAKLDEQGIRPTLITYTEESKGFLEKDNFIKRLGVDFNTIEGDVDIELPALLMIETENDDAPSHVWFCESPEKYEEDVASHIKPEDSIVAVVNLEKSN
jgi:hypothetical protein